MDHRFQGVSILEPFTYGMVDFSEYKTGRTAVNIFEMVTFLIPKGFYFELVTLKVCSKFHLNSQF